MFRTILMLAFWAAALPFAALVGFPWTYITNDVGFLYRMCMWAAFTGVRIAGVRVQTVGLEKIDPSRNYIFMSNHISNLDPPITLPLIPRRTSVMVKKELFSYPILGKIMMIGSLVPVDRANRDAGISAVRDAVKAIEQGLNMTIYIEGKRSFDGRLLPFKKGPFYLAEECRVPVVPITITGTQEVMPKARFAIQPGTVTVQFHDPIEPAEFGNRDCLMAKVRDVINRGLPQELREKSSEQSAG
ncbi:MAG: 1-acyl-sn-glycerol-3-phosphate acyltransferase [Acidobacteria bacterium]|jgi:1-acyl-sn-glycerol-3-phosphate acyltransferase|nr:MAG: 1-acyl-sn-glycerol-3-phosphate acyltransferase [Acidobacteriota bacterium]